jgi:hypothetical protein
MSGHSTLSLYIYVAADVSHEISVLLLLLYCIVNNIITSIMRVVVSKKFHPIATTNMLSNINYAGSCEYSAFQTILR